MTGTACRLAVRLLLLLAVGLGAILALPDGARAAEGWTWPVTGDVITPYRNGSDAYAAGQHRGIDVAAPAGAAVFAAAAGSVRFAGVAGSSGLTLSVRTADGRYDTSYLHLSASAVREGDQVRLGQRIGAVGTGGRRSTSQPHLHFGVREAGSRHAYRDPLGLLPPAGTPPIREAPRGAPLPVGAPVRLSPAPRPVRSPAPSRSRRRAPARRRVRLPAARRLPVPAGRRVRLPEGARARVPTAVRSPLARPLPFPQPSKVPAPERGADRLPAQGPAGAPQPAALADPRPAEAEQPRSAPAAGGGPNLGWALACAGLLLAAACLARPDRDERGKREGRSLGALLRPLLGRR